jgi:hypothetical protein
MVPSGSGGGVEQERFPGQFKKLEDKIKELVQRCHSLQETNAELEAKIYYLEGALKTKAAAEHRYVEEKLVIGEKIEGLITTLDQALGAK